MEFKKIYFAENEQGKPFSIDALPIKNTDKLYCRSCGSPLLLCTTHTQGRFFLHDLEHSDADDLLQCQHYIPPEFAKHPTIAGIPQVMEMPYSPQSKDYICVMCDYPYHGKKNCPRCGRTLYTTEVEMRDAFIKYAAINTTRKQCDGGNSNE
ncbi:putative zinc ribbon protein [Pectobacterium actinidiae]|uniref:putative zinc ribbon protein n=1 Tax=Pectobacterium actinidiae TaxID=1507808 RepID=UPI0037F55E19